jgi:transcription antitermination factor NusG
MATYAQGNEHEGQEAAWYVIRTIPEHELDTGTRMIERLRTRNLTQPGMQILIPKEIMVAVQDAEKYIGFVLVRMRMHSEAWKILWNTPGSSGFIGVGWTPTAFEDQDWMNIPFNKFGNE